MIHCNWCVSLYIALILALSYVVQAQRIRYRCRWCCTLKHADRGPCFTTFCLMTSMASIPALLLSVEVLINKETWLFISMYKQPKVRTMLLIDCLEAVTNECSLDNCNIVILGDLNVNMLKSNVLSDWLDISGLKNIIKEPTCKKGLPSLLDVLITNKPKRLQYSSSLDIGLSDFHNIVCAGTKCHVSKRKRTKIFYRSYKKFEETMFLHALSVAPFHVSEIVDEVDDAYWMCSILL